MKLDLRRMPMAELARLLRDIANELQSRGNSSHWNSTGNTYNRATGYGPAFNGAYGSGYRSGQQEFHSPQHKYHRRRRRRYCSSDGASHGCGAQPSQGGEPPLAQDSGPSPSSSGD